MTAKSPKEKPKAAKTVNRKARHEFFIIDTLEAGMELKGSEVKSLREGVANLKEGYVRIRKSQAYLEGVHIKPYSHSTQSTPDPVRSRRLLMHRREIDRWDAEAREKSLTIVPLKIYFKKGKAKVEIGLAKGKKLHDKRRSIKDKEAKRSLDRVHKKTRT